MEEIEFLSRALRSRWKAIALTSATALVAGFLFAYLLEPQFEATALVLTKPADEITLGAPSGSSKEVLDLPASSSSLPVETPGKTYIEIIKSRAVAEKVVRTLRLDDKPRGRVSKIVAGVLDFLKFGRFEARDPFEQAVRGFQENISLATLADTYLFEITYRASNPEEAANVANMAASMFVEYTSIAATEDARSRREFLAEERAEAEGELSGLRASLREFKEHQGSIALDEEAKEEISLLGHLQQALEENEARLAAVRATYAPMNPKVRALVAERRALERSISDQEGELAKLPEREARLAELELELAAATETYKLLTTEHEEARIREGQHESEIRIVSRAVMPAARSGPIMLKYALGSFLVALVLAIATALVAESYDRTIRSIEQAERLLSLSVIGSVPPWAAEPDPGRDARRRTLVG